MAQSIHFFLWLADTVCVCVCADDQPVQAATLPDSDLVIVKPDPADNPKQAAEKLVWSFLVLFENLVSARTLLKSLQEASLLVTPAPGQPALAKGTEVSIAEAFVKKLQVSMATHCNDRIMTVAWSFPLVLHLLLHDSIALTELKTCAVSQPLAIVLSTHHNLLLVLQSCITAMHVSAGHGHQSCAAPLVVPQAAKVQLPPNQTSYQYPH